MAASAWHRFAAYLGWGELAARERADSAVPSSVFLFRRVAVAVVCVALVGGFILVVMSSIWQAAYLAAFTAAMVLGRVVLERRRTDRDDGP